MGAEDGAGSLWGPVGSLGVRDGEQGVIVCQALSVLLSEGTDSCDWSFLKSKRATLTGSLPEGAPG